MESRNPVFSRTDAFHTGPGGAGRAGVDAMTVDQLEQAYRAPSAGPLATGRMTLDDVVVKTGIGFAVIVVFAAIGWNVVPTNPLVFWVGLIGGLVLGLVNAFKREPSPALIMAYAAFEGLFLGGISWMFSLYAGAEGLTLVTQAVLGTFAVFAVTLFAYKSGMVRATPRFRKMVLIALGGYLVFTLMNLVLAMVGVGGGWGLRGGWLGVAIGLFAVMLASFSLVLDFDFVEQGVKQGLPARYAWTAAFGLMVTLIWLYVEILRLLAILQSSE
jgi:uncharacterized YccA/Bax inhibitor family protein